MTGTIEQAGFIETSTDRLFSTTHMPAGPALGQVLVCAPLFEERKAAHRTLVDTARTLCSKGFMVTRFDYRGCGDSEGDFPAFAPEDWIADIRTAYLHMRRDNPAIPAGILGLRLGSTLAFSAAGSLPGLSFAIGWEPVLDGRKHIEQELRRKLVKEMMTGGSSRSSRAELLSSLQKGETVDYDGYALSARLYSGICAFTAATFAVGVPAVPVLLTAGRASDADSSAALAALQRAGCRVDQWVVPCPPFWNLLGIVDTKNQTRETLRWLLGMERSTP